MNLLDELLPKIKPYVLGWITDAQASAIGAHDLGGKLHSGTLLDSQAPQFLKTDGTRALIGNWVVLDGITIDGVDISAHASNISAHHEPVTILDSASIDFGLSGQEVTGSVIQAAIDHGSISGLADDDHTQYFNATRHTLAVHTGLGLVANTITLTAGNGLTGGGTLAANRTFDVGAGNGINVAADSVALNLAYSPIWTAMHTFNNSINASNILPRATDSYDLGSSAFLWRKIYASEFDTILLAQNTMSLIGGWLVVGKGEGTIASDVAVGSTTIDFGQAMTVDNFVLFRSFGQVEYMSVGSLVSGTTYNVTRNLDGSGANTWVIGSVFLVLGTSGDGRIELNAYDTPRISILEQGATYASQTERIRIGDLASWQGAGLTGMGIAIGNYSGNEFLAYSPAGGLLVRGTVRADDGFLANLDVTGKLTVSGASSSLAIGTTPPTSATVGTGLWLDRTGLYSLASNVYQVKIDAATGKFYAGGGVVTLDEDGISIYQGASSNSPDNAVKWSNGTSTIGSILGWSASGQEVLQIFGGSSDNTKERMLFLSTGGPMGDNYATLTIHSPVWTGAFASDISLGATTVSLIGSGSYTARIDVSDGAISVLTQRQLYLEVKHDGWISITDSVSYVSSSSIKFINTDVRTVFPVGTKIKFTQTTVKYFYVTACAMSSSDTLITLTGGSDYTVANAAISNFYYSHAVSAEAFPQWFNFVPGWISSGTNPVINNGTLAGRFTLLGKTCTFSAIVKAGSTTTYGTGQYYITLPITAYNDGFGLAYFGFGHLRDSGTKSYPMMIHTEPTAVSARISYVLTTTVDTTNLYIYWTPTSPFTFGTNDTFWMQMTYEIA